MNIAIRVDSSEKIGTGHIYRTLALAEKFREKKNKVFFICQKLPENLINLIKKKNFKVKVINNKFLKSEHKIMTNHFGAWSEKMQINDFKKTKMILNENKCDWIIIDHYGLSVTWEKRASKQLKVLVIDDLLNKKHFCDLYVNYHNKVFKRKQLHLLINKGCKILNGLKYVVINKKYLGKKKKTLSKKKKEIFIYMGGVDRKKMAIKIAKKIKNYFSVTVLLGKNCNYFAEILELAKKENCFKIIKKDYNSLKFFFENYNLIISSGGLSMYEQIYCGSNSLFIPQNKFQKKICYNLFKDGYINYLNSINKINLNLLNKLISSKRNTKSIIDGMGTDRIVNKVISFKY